MFVLIKHNKKKKVCYTIVESKAIAAPEQDIKIGCDVSFTGAGLPSTARVVSTNNQRDLLKKELDHLIEVESSPLRRRKRNALAEVASHLFNSYNNDTNAESAPPRILNGSNFSNLSTMPILMSTSPSVPFLSNVSNAPSAVAMATASPVSVISIASPAIAMNASIASAATYTPKTPNRISRKTPYERNASAGRSSRAVLNPTNTSTRVTPTNHTSTQSIVNGTNGSTTGNGPNAIWRTAITLPTLTPNLNRQSIATNTSNDSFASNHAVASNQRSVITANPNVATSMTYDQQTQTRLDMFDLNNIQKDLDEMSRSARTMMSNASSENGRVSREQIMAIESKIDDMMRLVRHINQTMHSPNAYVGHVSCMNLDFSRSGSMLNSTEVIASPQNATDSRSYTTMTIEPVFEMSNDNSNMSQSNQSRRSSNASSNRSARDLRTMINKSTQEAPEEDASFELGCDLSEGNPDDDVIIGVNGTFVKRSVLTSINWFAHTQAVRRLLMTKFDRHTLATHSLTGKQSPGV